MSWKRSYSLAGMLLFTAALLGAGCKRPIPGVLFLPTSAILPVPDPNETVQATYDSADGKARITVFPGATIPGAGITVDPIAPESVDPLLSNQNGDFVVRLGPSGSMFNPGVRLSLLIGAVATTSGGNSFVPSLNAFTTNGGQVEELPDVQVEITADGLLIMHVLLSHFSDVAVKAGIGTEIGILNPPEDGVYLAGETIPTQLTATNNNADSEVRFMPVETNNGAVGPIAYDMSTIIVPAESSNFLGGGSCKCGMVGDGNIEYDVNGDFKAAGPINPSLILYKRRVDVICAELETKMTVTFDPETHTTHYSVQVWHKTQSNNYQRQEITFDQRVTYRWTSANVCGMFDNPGNDYRNFYQHEGCSSGEEAQAQVQVEVSYAADDGTVKKRIYNAAARANEGAGPIDF